MPGVGLRYIVGAPIEAEAPGSPIEYGQGMKIGAGIAATISFERASNPLDADDVRYDDDNSITGGTASLNVADIEEDAQVALFGLARKTEGDLTIYEEVGAAGDYIGFGYLRERRKRGETSYQAYWVHKALLGLMSDNARTKGQTFEWQTPTVEGSIMGVYNDNTGVPKFREHANFETAGEAIEWLNRKANIASAASTSH